MLVNDSCPPSHQNSDSSTLPAPPKTMDHEWLSGTHISIKYWYICVVLLTSHICHQWWIQIYWRRGTAGARTKFRPRPQTALNHAPDHSWTDHWTCSENESWWGRFGFLSHSILGVVRGGSSEPPPFIAYLAVSCISTIDSFINYTQIIGAVSLQHVLFGINICLVHILIFLCCI